MRQPRKTTARAPEDREPDRSKQGRPRHPRPRKPKPVPDPRPEAPTRAARKSAAAPEPQEEDPVVTLMLDALSGGKSLAPMEIARHIAELRRKPGDGPDLWRRYMTAVKQQMVHLARQGRLEIVRKGRVVDPEDFKGVVRLRLPQG